MRTLLLALLLLLPSPAAAVTIRDYRAWSLCAAGPVADGAVIAGDWCASHSLFVSALIGPFPAQEVPVLHFVATADGAVVADESRTLPLDLGPAYDTLGVAFAIPLDADCCRGHAVAIRANLEILGSGVDPAIALTVLDPVPEPAPLVLLGSALLGLLTLHRRRQSC